MNTSTLERLFTGFRVGFLVGQMRLNLYLQSTEKTTSIQFLTTTLWFSLNYSALYLFEA